MPNRYKDPGIVLIGGTPGTSSRYPRVPRPPGWESLVYPFWSIFTFRRSDNWEFKKLSYENIYLIFESKFVIQFLGDCEEEFFNPGVRKSTKIPENLKMTRK